jgi:hypothetical protein
MKLKNSVGFRHPKNIRHDQRGFGLGAQIAKAAMEFPSQD